VLFRQGDEETLSLLSEHRKEIIPRILVGAFEIDSLRTEYAAVPLYTGSDNIRLSYVRRSAGSSAP
jgi:hypothetical protein